MSLTLIGKRVAASVVSVVLLLASLVISPTTVAAVSQNEIIMGLNFDGQEFTGDDPLDAGAGITPTHTAGDDERGDNGVVRTYDVVGYRIDYNINEDGSDFATITVTLPALLEWRPPTNTGMFSGCLMAGQTVLEPDGSVLAVPLPGSSITTVANTDDTLTCVVDATDIEGNNGTIFPVAQLMGALDTDVLNAQAVLTTADDPAGVSDNVDIEASARPKGNFVKGAPEVTSGVDNSGVEGRTLIWPISFRAAGGSQLGSEPIDDSQDLVFFDHMWDIPPTVVHDAGLVPGGRALCGPYDGTGPYPPGAATWNCTLVTMAPYPIMRIDIPGGSYDTTNLVPNANNSQNAGTYFTGQIAFWYPEAELQAKPGYFSTLGLDPPDDRMTLINTISRTDAPIANLEEAANIELWGSTAVQQEGPIADNDAVYIYADPPPPPGGTVDGVNFKHNANILAGPWQEWRSANHDGTTGGVGSDLRSPGAGGIESQVLGDARGGHMGGKRTPRGRMLALEGVWQSQSTSAPYFDAVHGCMIFDNSHADVVAMPEVEYFNASGRTAQPLSGGTRPPSDVLADVIYGDAASPFNNIQRQTKRADYNYVVEFGSRVNPLVQVDTPTTVTTDWSVAEHGATCNNDDVDPDIGWVPSTGNLAQFDPGGDGRYELIDTIRVRFLDDVPWHNPVNTSGGGNGFGFFLGVNIQVKDNPAVDTNNQTITVVTSRAFGQWDVETDNAPATTGCRSIRPASWNANSTTTGWCNLGYSDPSGLEPPGLGLGTYATSSVSPLIIENIASGVRLDAHVEKITIVDPRLFVTKRNRDGLADIADNGETVEYIIDVRTVGATTEDIEDIVLTDNLPAGYEFVSFTQLPSTAGATCSETAGAIECKFGDHPGGWSDQIKIEVRVVDTPADTVIRNLARVDGQFTGTDDAGNPVVVGLVDTDQAYSRTPAPYYESAVVKAVDDLLGPCELYPDTPADTDELPDIDPPDSAWLERCSMIGFDEDMSFTIELSSESNLPLTNVRFVDVFPHVDDEVEPPSATGVTGDGRSPESDFAGSLGFVSFTGADVLDVWVTGDIASTISRDPDVAETGTTWCDAIGGTVVSGPGLACPATADAVTAIMASMADVPIGGTVSGTLTLDSSVDGGDHVECDDYWTNTFGARVDEILLPIRSNDVTVMVKCDYDLALRKTINAVSSPMVPGVGSVTFDIEVFNQGDPVEDFDVTDYIDPTMWEPFDPALNAAGTTTGDQANPYTWDATDTYEPVLLVDGPLGAGESVVFPITLVPSADWDTTDPLSNLAEISRFDNDGNPDNGDSDPANANNPSTGALVDTDSFPDGDDNNDELEDNEIDENDTTGDTSADGTIDEDDHDIAEVSIFDLALQKVVDPATVLPATVGQDITFNVSVINQGNVAAADFTVVDYVDPAVWAPFDATGLNPDDAVAGYTTSVQTNGIDGLYDFAGQTLLPGDVVTFPVTLKVVDASDPSALVNLAEIASADPVDADGDPVLDENGDPVTDHDSTPDTDNTDPLEDDEIDENSITGDTSGDGTVDEDDHDIAGIDVFDLALKKVVDTTATTFPLNVGDPVTFTIEVTNQGSTHGTDIVLTDYVDTSVWQAFDPALNPDGSTGGDQAFTYAWSASGPANGEVELAGSLAPGETVTLPITLILDDASPGPLANLAEISEQTAVDAAGEPVLDPMGDPLGDVDSTPDATNDDELEDDETGEGPAVGDTSGDGTVDEDDHDIAEVHVFDLALKKVIDTDATTLPLVPGGDVTFTLEVTNQGSTWASEIALIDYVDLSMWAGFVAGDNPPGTTTGDQGLGYTWTAAGTDGAVAIDGLLAPGATIELPVTLTSVSPLPASALHNLAEISGGKAVTAAGDPQNDPAGDPLVDSDSTPDTDNTDPLEDDETGEGPSVGDTSGDGTVDEDDHDIAVIHTFDLALQKVVDTAATSFPLSIGDPVTFTIEVTNQGGAHGTDIVLMDYVDTSVWEAFDPALNPDGSTGGDQAFAYSWSQIGTDDGEVAITGSLPPGEAITVPVTLVLAASGPGQLANLAEIAEATAVDADGAELTDPLGEPLVDIDSTPDANDGDELEDDETGEGPVVGDVSGDGTIDEDDHDIAEVHVFDLALRKVVDNSATVFPVEGGDTATFTIEVINQGNTAASAIRLYDYVDLTMWDAFDVALNPAGNTTGDQAMAYTWSAAGTDGRVDIVGVLNPGETIYVPVTLTAVSPLPVGTDLLNTAEIERANPVDEAGDPQTDPAGDPLVDSDSTPDSTNDDLLIDDEVDDDGTNDEDDHDVAGLGVFDLALKKVIDTAATSFPLAVGDPVTFTIEVTNQGSTHGTDIVLTDYVDTAVWGAFDAALNPAGTTGGAQTLAYEWSGTGAGDGEVSVDGVLAPGETVTIPVTLVLAAGGPGEIANLAEISEATASNAAGEELFNPDGEPLLDVDSTPDDVNDDELEDDEIGEGPAIGDTSGDGIVDEDDHDIALVEVFDLALRKVLDPAATESPVAPGSTVGFAISVINQGNTWADAISLIDYVDLTMWEAFDVAMNQTGTTSGDRALPYAWSAAGTDGALAITGLLAPGEEISIPVELTVGTAGAPGTELVNTAEISAATATDEAGEPALDPNGDPIADGDSTPDTTNDDELEDDETGEGPAVGDVSGDGTVDEDDHDVASVTGPGYDLALIKLLDSVDGPIGTFTVSVVNQGGVDSGVIEVTDTLPAGTAFVSASDGGTETSPGEVTWSVENIPVGEQVDLSITIEVIDLGAAPFFNEAAITDAPFEDEDSDPYDDNADVLDRLSDTDTGIDEQEGDTDDHDIAEFPTPSYDLAIIKLLTEEVDGGAVFTVTVVNQGEVDSGVIEVTDTLPAGTAFVSASGGGTETSPGEVVWSIDNIPAGGATDLTIEVEVTDVDLAPFVNEVAITDAPFADEDSDPYDTNQDVIDRINPEDVAIDSQTGDTDDHDVAGFAGPVVDVTLTKVLLTPMPVVPGDGLSYEIQVRNQGPDTATNVEVSDVLPEGLSFVSAGQGGTNSGGQETTWTIDEVAVGDLVVLTIEASVDDDASGSLTNYAQVTDLDQTDVDSSGGENELSSTSPPDEDEESFATVVLGRSLDADIPDGDGTGSDGATPPLIPSTPSSPSSAPGTPGTPLSRTGSEVLQLLSLGIAVTLFGHTLLMVARRREE